MSEFQPLHWSKRLRVKLQNKRSQAGRLYTTSGLVLHEAFNKPRYNIPLKLFKEFSKIDAVLLWLTRRSFSEHGD